MDVTDFKSYLSQFLDEESLKRHFGNEPVRTELHAPFNNFFGDDLLTLLSRNTDILPDRLALLRSHLKTVSDTKRQRHLRAAAAVTLGRYVRERSNDPSYDCEHGPSPKRWFSLAVELNSVLGAWEFANEHLADRKLIVRCSYPSYLLPQLAHTTQTKLPAQSDAETTLAWLRGIHLSLPHVHNGFKYWQLETLEAALACIVNWLTLMPKPMLRQRVRLQPRAIDERLEAMKWIWPLWERLIEAANHLDHNDDARHQYLVAQIDAVRLFLTEAEAGTSNNPFEHRQRASSQSPTVPITGESMVVIPGVITPSAEKSESVYLAQYEVLRKPVALTPMPNLERLYAIRDALAVEFPWAYEALRVVMSGLVARRRHGVRRLGMQPILLAGNPGSGKTRFAQRLSDLLGTPNTVINLAGMSDVKVLKGVTRGWASNRPSRLIEFIGQVKVANPLFVLDEIDKAQTYDHGNGGRPHDALLDLLEPGNARRYNDIYLLTECDLSHCLYIATANSLLALPEPLLSRLQPVLFPTPGSEHAEVIVKGIVTDLEREWNVPVGTLTVSARDIERLRGLNPREMRRALLGLFGDESNSAIYTLH